MSLLKLITFRQQEPVQSVATWQTQSTVGFDNGWRSVCWSAELGLFVAVAMFGSGSNRVLTSPDGINWTGRASVISEWTSVCWSKELSLFVAVARNGTNRVMTSPDGINWTGINVGTGNQWYSVCWSPELGLFVAVDGNRPTNTAVMTSPDGINWTPQSTAGIDNSWTSVCWSKELGLFVAVAQFPNLGNQVMTSSDGVNWTAQSTTAIENSLSSVCWSPELGLFVAVTYNSTNRVMTSPDGINWTVQSTAVFGKSWQSITWSKEAGLFVAVASLGGDESVMSSSDGINWATESTAGFSTDNFWYSVCWSPELSLFAAVSSTGIGNRVMTSTRVASIDPDAQAFITATGITDLTEQNAVDVLVKDLKNYNLWSKMKAIYPMVGGTANTHKYNLKDPRDLDAAFRLNFQGGWTHNSNGVTSNNSYAITYVNPSVSLELNSAHLSVYSRTNAISGTDLGVFDTSVSAGTHMGISYGNFGFTGFRCRLNSLTPSTGYTPPNAFGLFTVSRTDNTNMIGYNRGSSVFTINSTANALPNYNIVLGAINNTGNINDFSNRNFAFASIGDGFSPTDVSNLYTAVQAFQTTLGRQV